MPRLSDSRSRKQRTGLSINSTRTRRLMLLCVSLVFVSTISIIAVRSADLSSPIILPGDLNIAPAAGMQFNPRVARGGNGFLAVWTDNRTVINGQISGIGAPTTGTGRGTLDDIYAARLDANGNVLDTLPIIVAGGQYNQEQPKVGWNGQNWLVAWQTQQESNPSYTEIRATRVAPDGTVLDAVPLVISSTQSSNSVTPAAVISDGANWVVMWETFPSGSVHRSVFVSRVSPSGVVLDPNGKEAYKHPSQYLDGPDIAFGGNGFLLTFIDIAAGPNFSNLLSGVRLNLDLDQNGEPFNISPAGYTVGSAHAKVAFNGQYYLAVWENGFPQTTHNPLAGSRVGLDGQLLDASPIQIVADMNSYAPQLDVCGDSATWFASYESANGTIGENIRVARVAANGTPLDPSGIAVHDGSRAGLAIGANGNAEVVFHDSSFDPSYSTSHVEGATVSNAGTVSTTVPISLGVPRQTRPRIAQGSNGYMVVFRSEIANDSCILAQRLDASTNPIDAEPIVIASGSPTNSNPSVAFNGAVYLVVWETSTSSGKQTLGRRVTPEGLPLDAAPFVIMTGEQPDVAALGDTFLVANIIQATSQKRYVQYVRVSSLGLTQGTVTRIDFSFNFVPRVAAFGNRWLLVWEHHANHDDSPGITYGGFVEPDGTTLGAFAIGGGSSVTPHLAVAGNTALVVWSGGGDIKGRRINADGTFLDPSSGYAITTAPNLQALPAVAWDGAQYIVDWVDQRNETYPMQPRGDIYGARVSVTNIPLEEFAIANTPLPEDTPFVIASNGLSIFAYAKFYDTVPYKAHRITLQTAQFAPPDLGTIPAAPTNLVVTEPNNNPYSNQLTWTDNSNNERGFKIEYKIGSTGAWSQIAIVSANVTSYTVSSVNTSGPAYYYRVRAQGLAGDSAYSNEAVPTNPPPTVAITLPTDGATFRAPAQLVVKATASDSNGTIQQVEFFNGSASWGTDNSSPYSITRFNVPAGTYVLRAVATDNRGATATSATVTVTVTPQNNNLIWSQPGGNLSFAGPSIRTQTATVNQEVSDDFDIVGTVERVVLSGYRDFNAPPNPPVFGAYVRFYAWVNGVPGQLQNEQFIAAGSPNLTYDPTTATLLDIQLPTAFTASGKHFMSVQLVTDGSPWWWEANRTNQPRLSSIYQRDNLAGGVWTHPLVGDGVFSLYGTLTGTPRIDSISPTSSPRSGYLTLTGANFGATQQTSRVLVDNSPAVIASWGDSTIKFYVPEAANFGTVQVRVETANGLSNAVNLNVTPRQQQGRIKWRFKVDGGYVWVRAAVGPDGTVYFLSDRGLLHALSAEGSLKWVKPATGYGLTGHLSVDADGTIYVATTAQPGGVGTPFVGAVRAINPDGTQKWQFAATGTEGVTFGPDPGPDGKIYAIFKPPTNSTPSLNLVALDAADGHQVWNYYDKYGPYSNGGYQLAFNAQLGLVYFQSASLSFPNTRLFAHRLDNGQLVNSAPGVTGDVAVAPDQTVHNVTQSFSSALALNWTFPLFGQGPTETQDIGADSVHYLVQNYYRLYAIKPDGTEKWHFDDCASQSSCRTLGDPIASPTNQVIFAPGQNGYPQPGYFLGINPSNGTELWRVPLPIEPGYGEYGQVRPSNRAVFAPDGQTAYVGTDVAAEYNYSYFYAVDTSATLPCSVSLSPQGASSPSNGGNGSFALSATASDCSWTVTSNVNWLTIVSGASGTGNAAVTYNVAANTTTSPRTGILTANNQTFIVTQAGVEPDSPTVQITAPANNATFQQPANIFVAANAEAAAGRTIARVEFYAGTTLIGTDTSAPYQIAWNDPATASYTLTARAIDNVGITTNSAPVYISLLPPSPIMPLPVPPPLVTSPTAEATYTAPATINIAATRQPSNYPTIRMEFYVGTTLLGTDTTAPYTFTWENVPPGRYTISVRNVANTGARATSQPIDITVNGENFNINGRVMDDNGVPLSGVPVVLNGSNFNNAALSEGGNRMLRNLAQTGNVTVVTDADGNYTFSNLPQGGSFTVAPTANGVAFVPAQAAFAVLHSDQSATFIKQPTARRTVADFDGDSRTDLSVWQSTSGIWHIIRSGNSATILQTWGQSALGDLAAPGDYDGDGKTDIAIFRPSDGNWYIIESSTGASTIQNWGQPGDLPVPADYDADGKTDVAVFRTTEGNWYVKKSGGGSTVQGWGESTDRFVPGDYDGDGKADIAVYRPSEGNWYIIKSTGGSIRENWGLGNDRPVAGDYDGDGKMDIAIFRPSEGNWYIKKSSGGNIIRNWGDSTDRPVPGDYDGDGKTDIAVWRPSEGTWYVINSGNSSASIHYLGVGGDIPLPAAFIP